MSNRKRENIFEILDDLIYHLNATKRIFTILILSAFILAPTTIILALVVIWHPRFFIFLLRREPELGSIISIHIIVSIALAVLWLFIGIQEYKFFTRWSERFKRFIESKEKIDKELMEDKDKTNETT